MKLVVGLGNPGRKYAETRHNIGFRVTAKLASRYHAETPRAKFQGECCETRIENERTLLLCPHTYMNRSGASVLAARDFYKVDNQDLLIICDDFNLPLAKLRMRASGSSGGQKGLENVIQRLGTDEISRLRFGIGPPPDNWDVADYVLSKFREDENELVQSAIDRATDAVAVWVRDGIEACMNQFNSG